MSAIDLTGVHVGGVPPPREEDDEVSDFVYSRLAERIRDHEDYRLTPLEGPGSFWDFTRERGELGEHGGGGYFNPAIDMVRFPTTGVGSGLVWAPEPFMDDQGRVLTPSIVGPGPGLIWSNGIIRESGTLAGMSAYSGHMPENAPTGGYRSRRDDPSREARAANEAVAVLGARWIDPLLSRPIF